MTNREIDYLISEKIFGEKVGWKRFSGNSYYGVGVYDDWFGSGPAWSATKFPDTEETAYKPRYWERDGQTHQSSIPKDYQEYGYIEHKHEVPRYTESISDAWTIVEKLGGTFDIMQIGMNEILWQAEFLSGSQSHAPTAPLAICLAALKEIK